MGRARETREGRGVNGFHGALGRRSHSPLVSLSRATFFPVLITLDCLLRRLKRKRKHKKLMR